MRIILTHEQADFDALASLVAVSLIDEGAIPVLPHRMNRNVRAFVTIYGMEFAFIEQRDLPSEPVEVVWLVDTQSYTTVRGIGEYTQIRVVDHHPRRDDLPGNWILTCEDTGATVTILVEALRERNGRLNVVEATLLLLGIYEDTGSLTYNRTTARDLQAASFLLEQGASLRIAADFLNHPLSMAQQRLYDELRSVVETHNINGHRIIVATGDAQNLEEELSTVAHKLRDLLDPDALFVIVKTRGGIQLIARSTSDHIHVGDIMDHFGGGGHDRAAAALIRDRETDDVRRELLDILPRLVLPAVTVSQIMSPAPQVFSPNTSVAEAASRMQRYGYEGYPVVEDGKVVGLLTRRAVDRAISHKLNYTANRLMDAGEVTIHPHDSIETLQRLMTDTGWGQIPVVHPDTDEIIGIVTRTDLLKTLTRKSELTHPLNLADRLDQALPSERLTLLKLVADTAHQQHLAAYIVGGFVRDLLLERPSLDFDIVVEGDAIGLAKALSTKYGGRITTHSTFGTAKWYLPVEGIMRLEKVGPDKQTVDRNKLPAFLDLITARTEFYTHPTALPTVESSGIKLDLHRRDFTINTMALRLDGHHYGDLHDFWGGLNDLRHGFVRVLHSLSFVDDPTRVIRAIRFEQRFGFTIEDRTMELMREAFHLIARISGDRIRHELDHVLDEEKAVEMLRRLEKLGVLKSIHPNLTMDSWLESRITELKSQSWNRVLNEYILKAIPGSWDVICHKLAYMMWLMRLKPNQSTQVATRIKLARSLSSNIVLASQLWNDINQIRGKQPSQIAIQLDDLPILVIISVCLAVDDPELSSVLQKYITTWRNLKPTTNGNDLKKRGLPPGPEYQRIIDVLRAAWLDGKITTQTQEKVMLDSLLKGLI